MVSLNPKLKLGIFWICVGPAGPTGGSLLAPLSALCTSSHWTKPDFCNELSSLVLAVSSSCASLLALNLLVLGGVADALV